MAEIPLLAQLLISKRQRDSERRREDALLSREDFRWEQEQARRVEQRDYDRERNRLADERLARMDQQANEDREFAQQQAQLGIATNPAVQPFGSSMGQGLGAMAADTMLRNSSRVMPSSAQSPTMALGDQLFRVRPQSELDAQRIAADEAEFQANVGRTQRMLQTIAPLAPEGARVSTVSPGSGSVTFASVPQPRVPPRPTRGDVTDARDATAFQAIQAARQAVGGAGASVLGRTDPELQAMASAYAESVGNPSLTLTILQMLREQKRNEQSAAKPRQGSGAGGGASATQQFLQGLNIPPIGGPG